MLMLLLAAGVCVALTLFYWYSNRKLNYWQKQNVVCEKPLPFFGNYKKFLTLQELPGEAAVRLCQKYPKEPYFGAYYGTEPVLIVKDPEIIKLITTKDFYYFNSREVSNYNDKEVTTQNLFFTQGDRWKVLRQNMTPLFSSAKMRNMFYLIENCTKQLEELLEFETKTSKNINMKRVMSKFTIDSICACAFGIDSGAMASKDKTNPFAVIGDVIFNSSPFQGAKIAVRAIWPSIFYALGFNLFPKKMTHFFDSILEGVFKERNYQPTTRNDFVDLMLNLNKNKFITGDSMANRKDASDNKIELEMTNEILTAQCIVFFAAGFETSSTTLSHTLYELSKHPEIQSRVLLEVDEYLKKHDNKLNYECTKDLPYLEACIDETLRLYPVLTQLTRETVEKYTLPSGVVLDKGIRIHLPVLHLHHNADFFPDPETFKPERFFGEAKQNIIPYTYLPFGEGPRVCIGLRFAKMQMFAGLVTLFKTYRVELAEGMPKKLEFTPTSIVTQHIGPINLKVVKRTK